MILGISEDFSSSVELDSQLKAIPSSGLYVNSGVHPSITIDNLLDFLPKTEFTFGAWNSSTAYSVFLTSRNRSNIVTKNSKIFECIQANTNQDPESTSGYWVETNIESLRIKMFLEEVKDKVKNDLSLTNRLINSQMIYDSGDDKTNQTLPNDYVAWVIEPKGSDYVSIRVNQMSLEKDGTTPVNVYVISQGELLDTITLTPNNGRITFRDTDISFSGKGELMLAIDSTTAYVGNATIDPLKFDSFVAYTAIGTGDAPETATYSYGTFGNGMGINISTYLNPTLYIEKNFVNLAPYIRATFEYMTFTVFQSNPNNRSNRAQRIQMEDKILMAELKSMETDTVLRRYYNEKKKAIKALEKTFDTQLNDHDGIYVKTSSV